MSRWFINYRQNWIKEQLERGLLRRADIMEKFDISMPQASKDLTLFRSTHPDLIVYDTRLKAYRSPA